MMIGMALAAASFFSAAILNVIIEVSYLNSCSLAFYTAGDFTLYRSGREE